ncbi:hypothetical protein RCL1_000317 [Eukaryota sp. TZLM3-RCL]
MQTENAVALFHFVAESDRELSMNSCDQVAIHPQCHNYKNSGWSKITLLKTPERSGWVPSLFLSLDPPFLKEPSSIKGINKQLVRSSYLSPPPDTTNTINSTSSTPVVPSKRIAPRKKNFHPIIDIPLTLPGLGTFSLDPDLIVSRFPPSFSLNIPIVPARLMGWLHRYALQTSNLFRSDAAVNEVADFITQLGKQEFYNLPAPPNLSVNTVATALKRYFRSLPVALIPNELFNSFRETLSLSSDSSTIVRSIRSILVRLSGSRATLLCYLIELLKEITRVNKSMNGKSLGIIFSQCIFSQNNSQDPTNILANISIHSLFVEQLITYFPVSFQELPFLPSIPLSELLFIAPPLPSSLPFPCTIKKGSLVMSWSCFDPLKKVYFNLLAGTVVDVLCKENGYIWINFEGKQCFLPLECVKF